MSLCCTLSHHHKSSTAKKITRVNHVLIVDVSDDPGVHDYPDVEPHLGETAAAHIVNANLQAAVSLSRVGGDREEKVCRQSGKTPAGSLPRSPSYCSHQLSSLLAQSSSILG